MAPNRQSGTNRVYTLLERFGFGGVKSGDVHLHLTVQGDNWRDGGIDQLLLENIKDGVDKLIRRGKIQSFATGVS